MIFKLILTLLLKIFLLNLIFSTCFCDCKKLPPKPELNCYCDSLVNLCTFTAEPDIRISNNPVDELKCDADDYMYCDINHNNASTSCGVRKIRNGQGLFGAHPWHASFYKKDKGSTYITAGVLITPWHVITAAHGISEYVKSQFTIRFGEWDHTLGAACPTVEGKPSLIKIHPEFDLKSKTLVNDIAIIKLENKILLPDHPPVNTACLATTVPAAGTKCVVAGWGRSDFNFEGYQDELQEAHIPIVDNDACEKRLRTTRLGHSFKLDRDSFICAGGELGVDSCKDDGGAPLMCENNGQYEVVGLVSWGIRCATKNPGVYVNIPHFRDWILEQIYLFSI